jgi:FkbM family methyltransferase
LAWQYTFFFFAIQPGSESVYKMLIFVASIFSLHADLIYNLVEGKPDLYIDSFSERIGHTWVDGNVWDKPLIGKFYALLSQKEGPFTVLDIGAQTGSFSLLAKYFPHSKWYAFEPIWEASETLKTNLRINSIQNVSVHQMAVSDYWGQAILKMPEIGAWGLSTLGENVLRFSTKTQREVDCVNLDHFIHVHGIGKVDFIKIDTEGGEFAILRGAQALIQRDHPVILMEFNKTNLAQCGVTPLEVESLLQSLDYQWEFVSNEDILCVPK